MKLTPWFPGKTKPVRKGVYQRRYAPGEVFFCYWNGKHWRMYGTTPNEAKRWSYAASGWQLLPWRGVEK